MGSCILDQLSLFEIPSALQSLLYDSFLALKSPPLTLSINAQQAKSLFLIDLKVIIPKTDFIHLRAMLTSAFPGPDA